jgi:hypothetical protein
MKLLRGVSLHSNVFRSTGPRYFTSMVSDRTSAVSISKNSAVVALINVVTPTLVPFDAQAGLRHCSPRNLLLQRHIVYHRQRPFAAFRYPPLNGTSRELLSFHNGGYQSRSVASDGRALLVQLHQRLKQIENRLIDIELGRYPRRRCRNKARDPA